MVLWVDERVLVDAARDGDVEAFGELVRRYQLPVYRVALRMLGSSADAEDAAQEAFVAAWRGIGRFRGDGPVSRWLYRIVTNRCLNFRAAARPTAVLDADTLPGGQDPAELALAHERFEAVAAAVADLPPDLRAAIVLRDFEGLAYEEVAEVLQVSLATVKGRIHRARARLLKEASAWR